MFVIGADDLELTFQHWRWVGTTPGEEKIPKLRHDRWEEVAAPKGGHGVHLSLPRWISCAKPWFFGTFLWVRLGQKQVSNPKFLLAIHRASHRMWQTSPLATLNTLNILSDAGGCPTMCS